MTATRRARLLRFLSPWTTPGGGYEVRVGRTRLSAEVLSDDAIEELAARVVADYPLRPDALWFHFRDYGHNLAGARGRDTKPGGSPGNFYTDDDVERLRAAPPIQRWATVGDDVDPPPKEPDPQGEARRREIVEAHDGWMAARREVDDAVGFTAASDAEDAAAAAWNAADEAVKLCQPQTLAGLARKAAWVAARLSGGGCDDDLGEVFARQVAAFGGVAS